MEAILLLLLKVLTVLWWIGIVVCVTLEGVSKIPPKRDPEASKIEERVVDGE